MTTHSDVPQLNEFLCLPEISRNESLLGDFTFISRVYACFGLGKHRIGNTKNLCLHLALERTPLTRPRCSKHKSPMRLLGNIYRDPNNKRVRTIQT